MRVGRHVENAQRIIIAVAVHGAVMAHRAQVNQFEPGRSEKTIDLRESRLVDVGTRKSYFQFDGNGIARKAFTKPSQYQELRTLCVDLQRIGAGQAGLVEDIRKPPRG